MASVVRTVTGDIAPEGLGYCQPHEHIFSSPGEASPAAKLFSALRIDDPRKTLKDLLAYKESGGSSVVDALPVYCGRDISQLCGLSRKSGVRIIASTGFHRFYYYEKEIIDWYKGSDVEMIADLFVSEIEEGASDGGTGETIGSAELSPLANRRLFPFDSGTRETSERMGSSSLPYKGQFALGRGEGKASGRAGLIKTAIGEVGAFSFLQLKLLSAAAKTQTRTGAALMIHTEPGADVLAAVSFLEDSGVDPAKIVVCHMDRTEPDLSVHKAFALKGCFLEYDTVLRPKYHGSEKEISILLEMASAGFLDRMLLSLDVTRERLSGYGGVPGLAGLIRYFLPLLRTSGFDEKDVHKIFCENPARALSLQVQERRIP